jgi:NADH-quinone oxidoreductase subunit A
VLAGTQGDNTASMFFQFANVLVFFGLSVLLVGGMLALGSLLRPSNPEALKLTTYECGEPPTGNAWVNFNIRFYLIALIFVIFDVEVAFIYPVAAVFRDWVLKGQGLFALLEVLTFLGILFVGLVYVWVKGDLEWLKRVPSAQRSEDRMREAA